MGINTIYKSLLMYVLSKTKYGTLNVKIGQKEYTFTGQHEKGLTADLTVIDESAFKRIVLKGGIGLAESYMNGLIDTSDIEYLLEIAAKNLAANHLFKDLPNPMDAWHRLEHKLRPNNIKGSSKNIAAHYDIGNDFYKLWLDQETLAYSSAIFEKSSSSIKPNKIPDQSVKLSDAQQRKWDRIIKSLDIKKDMTVLEIGCGWGGFSVYLAKKIGCDVVGVTNSKEMHKGSVELAKIEHVDDKTKFILSDYRKLSGQYDRIVSIEMFEAVGEEYWPTYFRAIKKHMKANGKVCIQTITIDEKVFYRYRKRSDFIQKYIFPGGMLPSINIFKSTAAKYGLKSDKIIQFGQHYALTLHLWLKEFDAQKNKIIEMGYDDGFIRMWRYYLAYCRAGFITKRVDDVQIVLTEDKD